MTYKTSAIFVDATQQKMVVDVEFTNTSIIFNQSSYAYPNVHFESGGSGGSLLFAYLPDGEIVYFSIDHELRKNLSEIEGLKPFLKNIFDLQAKRAFLNFGIVAAMVLLVGSMIYFRGPLAGLFAGLISPQLERNLADRIFNRDGQEKLRPQRVVDEKLTGLVKELKEFDAQKYTIHFSSDMDLNAYATIGGHIFINRGLLKSLPHPEDLLGVVAHEMVHAKNRHVVRSLFQSLGLFVLFQALLGDVSGIAAVLLDSGGPLLNLSYTRELEAEADAEAVTILLESGVDPAGLGAALGIIEAQAEKQKSETPGAEQLDKLLNHTFLRSHPKTADRKQALNDLIAQRLTDTKYQNLKFKNLKQPWSELQTTLSTL